jgi:hypothetical protein
MDGTNGLFVQILQERLLLQPRTSTLYTKETLDCMCNSMLIAYNLTKRRRTPQIAKHVRDRARAASAETLPHRSHWGLKTTRCHRCHRCHIQSFQWLSMTTPGVMARPHDTGGPENFVGRFRRGEIGRARGDAVKPAERTGAWYQPVSSRLIRCLSPTTARTYRASGPS